MHHPFHLHGYHFMVTDLGRNEDNPMTIQSVQLMESRNILPRSATNILPPLKDTVSIPSRGYAKLRFRATNPGKLEICVDFSYYVNFLSFKVFG